MARATISLPVPLSPVMRLGRGGFDEEIRGARLHGFDNGVDAALRGQHDNGQFLAEGFCAFKGLHAAKAGHAKVEHHQRNLGALLTLQERQGAFAVSGLEDRISRLFAHSAHQAALRRIIPMVGHGQGGLLQALWDRVSSQIVRHLPHL